MVEKRNVVADVAVAQHSSDLREKSMRKLKEQIIDRLENLQGYANESVDLLALLAHTCVDRGMWSEAAAACQVAGRLSHVKHIPNVLYPKAHEN